MLGLLLQPHKTAEVGVVHNRVALRLTRSTGVTLWVVVAIGVRAATAPAAAFFVTPPAPAASVSGCNEPLLTAVYVKPNHSDW